MPDKKLGIWDYLRNRNFTNMMTDFMTDKVYRAQLPYICLTIFKHQNSRGVFQSLDLEIKHYNMHIFHRGTVQNHHDRNRLEGFCPENSYLDVPYNFPFCKANPPFFAGSRNRSRQRTRTDPGTIITLPNDTMGPSASCRGVLVTRSAIFHPPYNPRNLEKNVRRTPPMSGRLRQRLGPIPACLETTVPII